MTTTDLAERTALLQVENIGGIEETSVEIPPGVTILAGRNATNRTSLLQALMAVMGSDNVSVKANADEAHVEIEFEDGRYTRDFTRTANTLRSDGDPYLEDTTVADLFAFLLESNEARRAVAQGADLRELIMRPVDTDAIQAEIQQLKDERSRIDETLDELESLKNELPKLEKRRTELEEQIAEKRAALEDTEAEIEELDADVDETREEKQELEEKLDELRQKRSTLERLRSDIDLQQESIESLKNERSELEAEQEELTEVPMGEYQELEQKITRLRNQKNTIENEVSGLQDIIQFNEEMLGDEGETVGDVLENETNPDGSVTDQLLDETVVCWTCGSEVERERITDTLDELREMREEKMGTVREIENELDELQEKQREYKKQEQRRERIEQKLEEISQELDERRETLESHRDEREQLNEEIKSLETDIERLESEEFSDILDLHKEANQIEFELGQLESDLDDVTDRITDVEEEIGREEKLRAQREEIQDELEDLRTRIDQIEKQAIEEFNEHMDAVLEILDYENLVRIWIERVEQEVREGRRKVEKTMFELHVVRSTDSGATYEDTVDHLSESEREVTGLIFALAGYLVHDLHEEVPFMLLDSLEAIDSERLADLIDYIADYPQFLVAALLPEDAQAIDERYTRISDI